MSHAERMDKASGIFFFLGFLSSKLQYLPIALLSGISNLLAMGFYTLGYILWLGACRLAPNHPALPNKWYGFSQFRDQHAVSAIIGVSATICCCFLFLTQSLIIPVSWLFFLSNIFWAIGEYHKLNNPPPNDPDFIYERQQYYCYYSGSIVGLSLMTAIATTIGFVFPPAAMIVLGVSLAVGFFLAAAAAYFWFRYTFYSTDEQKKEDSTYAQCAEDFGITPAPDKVSQLQPEMSPPAFYGDVYDAMVLNKSPLQHPINPVIVSPL